MDKFPDKVDEYLLLNDIQILSWGLDKQEYKDIFIKRKFFRCLYESSDHPTPEEIDKWEKFSGELKKYSIEEPHDFFIDTAEKAAYNFAKPDIQIQQNNKFKPIHEISKLIGLIEKLHPVQKMRLYVNTDKFDKINELVNNFF